VLAGAWGATGVAEHLVSVEADLVSAHRLQLGEQDRPTGTEDLVGTVVVEMNLTELLQDEATDEIEFVSQTVFATATEVTAERHEVDHADKIGGLAVNSHVTAILRRDADRNHLVVEFLGLADQLTSLVTKFGLVNVLRNNHLVFDDFGICEVTQ